MMVSLLALLYLQDFIWGDSKPLPWIPLQSIAIFIPIVLISSWLATFVHELGHLLAGWIVGSKPVLMVVGLQRPLFRLHMGNFCYVQGRGIAGGYVITRQLNRHGYRWRQLFEILGGPLTNLAFAGLTLLIMREQDYSAYLGEEMEYLLSFFARCFVLLSILGSLTLVPIRYSDKSLGSSDGLMAIEILRASNEKLDQLWENEKRTPFLKVDDTGMIDFDMDQVRDQVSPDTENAQDLLLLYFAMTPEYSDVSRPELTAKIGFRFLDEPDLLKQLDGAIESHIFLDSSLTSALQCGEIATTYRNRAEGDARRLVAMAPPDDAAEKLTREGTLGSVLVELNKLEEGSAILERVYRETQTTIDQQYSSGCLAIARARQGNVNEATAWLEKAKLLNTPPEIIQRAEAEIRDAGNHDKAQPQTPNQSHA